jgi:hypothetical protein
MKLPFLAVALFLAALFAAQPSHAQNAFTPDQVKYGPAPPFLPPGAQLAVLEGDPMAASGDFTIRLKMPDGYKVAPHTHPHRENVTVLSGILKVGMGDQFDATKMMSFGAGSFAYLDPTMHHLRRGVGGDCHPDSRDVAGTVQLHQPGGRPHAEEVKDRAGNSVILRPASFAGRRTYAISQQRLAASKLHRFFASLRMSRTLRMG